MNYLRAFLICFALSGCASLGQVADKGTTAYALNRGYLEANPLMPKTAVGALAVGVGFIAVQELVVRKLPTESCLSWSKAIGVSGWAAAANNVAILAGASIGWPAAIVAGIVAFNLNYASECK